MAAQHGCVGGQVYRKDQEREEQVANREEKISEIQRRKDGNEILEN